MIRKLLSPQDLSDHAVQKVARPAMWAAMLISGAVFLYGLVGQQGQHFPTLIIGLIGVGYSSLLLLGVKRSVHQLRKWEWSITLLNAAIILAGLIFLPASLIFIPCAVTILVATVTVILLGKVHAYVFVLTTILSHFIFSIVRQPKFVVEDLLQHGSVLILALVITEVIQRLNEANLSRIKRLQTINEFARQVAVSLEMEQVMTLIGAAILKAIEAETYFLGLVDEDQLHIHLMYDDGEFFPSATVSMDGTLSGWVIRNQKSLFIPNMRRDVNLEGIQIILTGNNRDNACWMGVPMRSEHVNGVIVVASYTPNSFDSTDLELLENLAQQAALALGNAFHHSEVEEQSRRDSLTGVFNHGNIVKILRQEAEKSQATGIPLSLIMLDIDHFKQYNDNYGHQMGDEVLISLTRTIRQHIKSTDALGRWGGEEFTIVLPAANGVQAMQIAERVQRTVNTLSIHGPDQKTLPFPTVSQGIAVFPSETNDVDQLIHLADQRLYIAKARGRNQIEPHENHWQKIIA